MAEPNAVVAGCLAGAACTPALIPFFGIPVDALIAGVFASVCVTMMLKEIDRPSKSFFSVILSTVGAGASSPILTHVVATDYPVLISGTDIATVGWLFSTLRISLALLVGATLPIAFPIYVRYLKRKGGTRD